MVREVVNDNTEGIQVENEYVTKMRKKTRAIF
jgi:hypothetical protein